MSDFTPKREVLERKLRTILDELRLLSSYVDEPGDIQDALDIIEAVQFCHTEEKLWPCEIRIAGGSA